MKLCLTECHCFLKNPIKGIKFLEIIQDQARDVHTETEAGRFDANFTIMTEAMRGLIKDLFKTFGEG